MRKIIGLILFVVCPFMPWRPPAAKAQQASGAGTVTVYDSTGKVVGHQAGQGSIDMSPFTWLKQGQQYSVNLDGVPYTPGAAPTPTPAPVMVPVAPAAPPSYVTGLSTLALKDDFVGQNGSIGYELAESGQLIGGLKWLADAKADNTGTYGGYLNHSNGVPMTQFAAWAYGTPNGYLSLDMHAYTQSAQWPKGDNQWFHSAICSASYATGALNGVSTGTFLSPPFYVEVATFIPPLKSFDIPQTAGLWPSIVLYTEPGAAAALATSLEIDVFELYSIDYTIPHCSWHTWHNGQQGSYGTVFTHNQFPDLSAGWHVWGLWVDGPTGTIHWYLDGAQIFTQPMPTSTTDPNLGSKPLYLAISNSYGGGFLPSMSLGQHYNMGVAYVRWWTK